MYDNIQDGEHNTFCRASDSVPGGAVEDRGDELAEGWLPIVGGEPRVDVVSLHQNLVLVCGHQSVGAFCITVCKIM